MPVPLVVLLSGLLLCLSACANPEASGRATTPVSPGGEILPDEPPQGAGAAAVAPAVPLDEAPSLHQLPDPVQITLASLRDEATFGGEHPGFVWWASTNARLVAVYRFLDGPPSFGHHGEAMGAAPTLTLYDTVSGRGDDWDELVTADPAGRYAVMRRGATLMLFDSDDGVRTDLSAAGADASPDSNACLPPRQAAFGPLGRTLAWSRREPTRVVLRFMASGVTTTAPIGDALLWRAEPAATPGWFVAREVAADSDGDGERTFPQQRTSCSCRWCNRFAASYGFYGWGGDDFTSVLVGPGGERVALDTARELVGDAALVDAEGGALTRLDGTAIAPPEGCVVSAIVVGAPALALACEGESRLWWPSAGRSAALGANIELVSRRAIVGSDGYVWGAVRVLGDTPRIARLRFDDGRLEVGPMVGEAVTPHPSGWLLADDGEGGTLAFDVARGRSLSLDVQGRRAGLSITRSDDDVVVLAPDIGAYGVLDGAPAHTTPSGCAVLPASASERGLEQGPWRLRCPGR